MIDTVQLVDQYTPDGTIRLPCWHRLLAMSDDEFARAVDDPFWQHVALVIYRSVFGKEWE